MKTNRFKDLIAEVRDSPEEKVNSFLEQADESVFRELEEELTSLVLYSDFTNVLTDTGVVAEPSLLREFSYRANRKLFPPVYPDKECRHILSELDSAFGFSQTVLDLSPNTISQFLDKVFTDNPIFEKSLRRKLHAPIKILVTRLIYNCTSRHIFDRLTGVPHLKESILDLDKAAYQFLELSDKENYENLLLHLAACESACAHIRDNRSAEGISLHVTYQIMSVLDHVLRIRTLITFLLENQGGSKKPKVAQLIQSILLLESESAKIGALFWEYVELVFYEITEHTGRKGEDYIQRDSAGTKKMLNKGLLGGLIVGLLAFLKPMLAEVNLAPFIEALGFSFIYSGILLLIYFLGGVLATKQPAMTASKLANELDRSRPSNRFLWETSGLIRDTFRSQFLAIFGNFILALPVAAAVTYLLRVSDIYIFNPETETYLLRSLHPIFSFSIFYAALTGVCLAASGIAAGAIRNWFIFNKIDLRLKDKSYVVTLLGRERATKLSDFIDEHLEGLAGNLSLGFLLGFLSTLGSVLGLPIDIRHITFASAQVGSALANSTAAYGAGFIAAIISGVLLIGLINLAVSFSITFFIAFKSRKLTFDQGRRLLNICIGRFFKEPAKFLYKAGE